jgi:hypothetical protein
MLAFGGTGASSRRSLATGDELSEEYAMPHDPGISGAQTTRQDQAAPEAQPGFTRQVEDAAGQVADEAKRAGSAVKAEAAGLAGKVKDETWRQAEGGREQVAQRLATVATNIRETSGDLRQREAWLADLLDVGARELGDLAGTLQRRDLGSLISSLESFARRQPALYAGAAVALGFAAARLAKSTAQRGGYAAGTSYGREPEYRGSTEYGRPSEQAGSPPYAAAAAADDEYLRAAHTGSEGLHEEPPVMGGGFAPSAADADRARADRTGNTNRPAGEPL